MSHQPIRGNLTASQVFKPLNSYRVPPPMAFSSPSSPKLVNRASTSRIAFSTQRTKSPIVVNKQQSQSALGKTDQLSKEKLDFKDLKKSCPIYKDITF